MALIVIVDGRDSVVTATTASGAKSSQLMNLDFVAKSYWGGSVPSATFENERWVYFIHGVYDNGATSRGGTTAFKYEAPAVAKAVYAYMLKQCAANTLPTIALDLTQNSEITLVSPATGAAGVPVSLSSAGLFKPFGVVTLSNIADALAFECQTTYSDDSTISFIVPAGLTAAHVYDVVWTHPDGYYAFKLAAFTAA